MQFVEEYLRHEMLWNFRSPNYWNKQQKKQSINATVATMAIPDCGFKESELKIKILLTLKKYNLQIYVIKLNGI